LIPDANRNALQGGVVDFTGCYEHSSTIATASEATSNPAGKLICEPNESMVKAEKDVEHRSSKTKIDGGQDVATTTDINNLVDPPEGDDNESEGRSSLFQCTGAQFSGIDSVLPLRLRNSCEAVVMLDR
jgi:hypothetical protein